MVLALAGAAKHMEAFDLSALLLVGFDTFMRTGELFTLKRGDVSLYRHKAVLRLHHTKTSQRKGKDEYVVVGSSVALTALRHVCSLRSAPDQRILGRTVANARMILRELLQVFNLDPGEFNYYSLRRGGATSYFYRTGSMSKTLATGRWENASTARMYIEDGAAQAGQLSLTDEQLRVLMRAARFLSGPS